jgi:hypothetical protein
MQGLYSSKKTILDRSRSFRLKGRKREGAATRTVGAHRRAQNCCHTDLCLRLVVPLHLFSRRDVLHSDQEPAATHAGSQGASAGAHDLNLLGRAQFYADWSLHCADVRPFAPSVSTRLTGGSGLAARVPAYSFYLAGCVCDRRIPTHRRPH